MPDLPQLEEGSQAFTTIPMWAGATSFSLRVWRMEEPQVLLGEARQGRGCMCLEKDPPKMWAKNQFAQGTPCPSQIHSHTARIPLRGER